MSTKEERVHKLLEKKAESDAPVGLMADLIKDEPFGVYSLNRSEASTDRVFTHLSDLTSELIDKEVWVRAFVHTTRGKGKSVFVVLRQSLYLAQAVMFERDGASKEILKFTQKITNESIVDIYAKVVGANVNKATQKDIELKIQKIYVVSQAAPNMPFQLEDAMRKGLDEDQNAEKKDNNDTNLKSNFDTYSLWWLIKQNNDFDNIAFSRRVEDSAMENSEESLDTSASAKDVQCVVSRYLTCADCEERVLGLVIEK